jgi:hypothetical protein
MVRQHDASMFGASRGCDAKETTPSPLPFPPADGGEGISTERLRGSGGADSHPRGWNFLCMLLRRLASTWV